MDKKTVTVVLFTVAAIAVASSMGLTPRLITGQNRYYR